ncbi:MAG: hypothetical protein ACOYXN_13585 [Acidobacteriota bacterium]
MNSLRRRVEALSRTAAARGADFIVCRFVEEPEGSGNWRSVESIGKEPVPAGLTPEEFERIVSERYPDHAALLVFRTSKPLERA